MADFNVINEPQFKAMQEFIANVYRMRQSQLAFDVTPSGSHLCKKIEFEKRVDASIEGLLTPEVLERCKSNDRVLIECCDCAHKHSFEDRVDQPDGAFTVSVCPKCGAKSYYKEVSNG